MAEMMRKYLEDRADEVALVDEFTTTTYGSLDERVNRLIHGMRSLGFGVGDVVAILTGNRSEFFELAGAAGHMGLQYSPINWHFTADEIAYILEDSGAKALLVDHEFADVAAEATERVPGVGHRIVFGGAVDGFADYEDLLAASDATEPDDQVAGDTMFYTSGTTGRPKGLKSSMIEVGSPVASVEFLVDAFAQLIQIPRDGVALVNSPVYHAGPWAMSILPLNLGSRLVIRRKFDPAETLRLIDEHQVTTAYGVPTQFVRLLRLPDEVKQAFDGSSLQYVLHTAAPCPVDVKRELIDWWGPVIYEAYGATEGGFDTFITSQEWLERPGSVGKALPIAELLILDDDRNPLGPNDVGQVYKRSLMGADFEYHNSPEKTADAHLEPGVYTYGDMGYLDDDGYLFLTDRKIDMIISGGVNIYPAEIEAELLNHPAVGDTAVFGIPNDEFGEEVKAAIQTMNGVEASEELIADLNRFCRERLAGYKCPRSFDFVDDFPRTETGKLQKRLLRDPYWEGIDRRI